MPICEVCHFLIHENLTYIDNIKIVKTKSDRLPYSQWKYYHSRCFNEYTKNPQYKSINSSSCCFK